MANNENASEKDIITWKDKTQSAYYIRSVIRAMAVLDCFKSKPTLGVTEISKILGIHKSTVYALLVTLEATGYVCKSEDAGRFFLSHKFLQLANVVKENSSLRNIALPHMTTLYNETGESVALHVCSNNRKLAVAVVEGDGPMNLKMHEGDESTLCYGAGGRVLLSGLSDDQIISIVEKDGLDYATPDAKWDINSFLREVHKIADLGYDICNGEQVWYAGSIGWPIKNESGQVIAALTIFGPLSRYKDDKLKFYFEKSRICAERITSSLNNNYHNLLA